MKQTVCFVVLSICLICAGRLSANVPPMVTNVSASQRSDGSKIVDIWYSVNDADNDTLTVSVKVSNDNGATFGITPSPANLSGAVGENILSGNNKHIVWNAGAEGVSFDGSQFKVKVTATEKIDLTTGLVAYYPFNGNANDESGNGHDGVMHGCVPTNDRFMNPNQAMLFDGNDDYLVVTDAYDFNILTGNLTISFWVKGLMNQSNVQYNIIDMSHSNYVGWTFQGQPSYSGLAFAVTPVTGDNSPYNQLLYLDSMVLDNRWHLLAGVYSDTIMQIYFDGMIMGSTSNLVHPNPPSYGYLYIGGFMGIYRNFRGLVDDIRVYNTFLNASEIQALYHEGGWTGNP